MTVIKPAFSSFITASPRAPSAGSSSQACRWDVVYPGTESPALCPEHTPPCEHTTPALSHLFFLSLHDGFKV